MLIIVHLYSDASILSLYYFANYMNNQEEKTDKCTGHSSKGIPVLSEYAKSLEGRVKERYSQKISVIGVDPATIPAEQLSPECLPPVEVSDLLSYLVLETSFYTNKQFKAFKSLEAFNQMVSGFVTSVVGKVIAGKYVVRARVRRSQRMNDPLVNIWVISENDGTILSAHCFGCKAESCSHIASVLFYLEATTRIHGKLACTQVKCSWILPTYVNEVPYARAKDIDFSSAKKLKEKLDQKIEDLQQPQAPSSGTASAGASAPQRMQRASPPSKEEMDQLYAKLNQCKIKAAALSLIGPFADQFIDQSRSVPVVSELFHTDNLNLGYSELLAKCIQVQLNISADQIKLVEETTRAQSKGTAFFKHRAGRIGASISGAVLHTNLSLPSQSLIKTICYPSLYKLNTTAVKHGCKHEDAAIQAYETVVKKSHTNFQVKKCGLFINQEYPFLHATPDFLTSCDCCGLGCGEVKCPLCTQDANFENYAALRTSCLVTTDGGGFKLKRSHNYYFQVQQQLFTLKERRHNDFIVYAIDNKGNGHFVMERILPDVQHWNTVLPKLKAFWRICVLPEVLGRWYSRRCIVEVKGPDDGSICFCRTVPDGETISCSNENCPYGKFHPSCLSLTNITIPKKWYCPHCSRLQQFKRYSKKQTTGKAKGKASVSAVSTQASLCDTICICEVKATTADRLVECHGSNCTNGKFFHLQCLGLKRMPTSHKTTWRCYICCTTIKTNVAPPSTSTPTTCSSSEDDDDDVTVVTIGPGNQNKTNVAPPSTSTPTTCSSSEDDDDDVTVVTTGQGNQNKTGPLATLTQDHFDLICNPLGWLDCDIIQQAHILLHNENLNIEGFQRPTLGPVRNFNIVSGEFVQILHTGNSHWVCVSSIGCPPGHVKLYDSLYNDAITQEIEQQTNDLLGGRLLSLVPASVQQQSNGSDCGIFAIAFAACLVFGIDPSHVNFDVPTMRPHLAACLRNKNISLFPLT